MQLRVSRGGNIEVEHYENDNVYFERRNHFVKRMYGVYDVFIKKQGRNKMRRTVKGTEVAMVSDIATTMMESMQLAKERKTVARL